MINNTKEVLKTRIRYTLRDMKVHTAKDLAWYALIQEKSDTCPTTRGLVREMIEEGELIGSSAKGYKNMDTGKEVQVCLNSLLARQLGISRRIQSIYDAALAKGIL
jgi:hypothetical protein